MKKYIYLILGLLLIGISLSIVLSNRSLKINYNNKNTVIYNIYLDGEVNYKGNIELPKGTKIKDFIYEYVTEYSDLNSLNLEDEIENNMKYYINKLGKISINKATLTELKKLNGIGDVYANAIINNRPYSDIIELKDKKIIRADTYEKIKEFITI